MLDWREEIRERLANLNVQPTRKAEIVEELSQHLEDSYQELLYAGMSDADARQTALAELTGSDLLRNELRRVTRTTNPEPVVLGASKVGNIPAEVWQDLRYALRLLRKQPALGLVAIVTLALGIGMNTAIFSVVNGVLLRPLPYTEPEHLAMLWTDDPTHGVHEEGTSYLNFEDWKNQTLLFADMAICTRRNPVSLTGANESERVQAEAVSANLFSLLGKPPMLGRTFSTDDVERRERVVVLSYGLWQRRFGGSADVIGKDIEIDGQSVQVIGVMPRDFFFPSKETQLWEPVTSLPRWDLIKSYRYNDWWRVVGRLKPGVSFQQAQNEMNAVGLRLETAYPTSDPDFAGFGVNVVPLVDQVVGTKLKLALWSLLGATFFVLLIACLNLANLLLARGTAREREFAIRLALGASRARLVRQLLSESAMLALTAGLIGLALAVAGREALVAFAPQDIPRLDEIGIDARVLAFTFSLSLLASILFGLLPAWRMSRTEANESLKEGGRGSSGGPGGKRTRGLLVVTEISLAVVLLVGTGLLVRSFLRIQAVEPGFDPEHVLTMKVDLPPSIPRAQWWPFYQQVFGRTAALPGVESVGAANQVFLELNPDIAIYVEGSSAQESGQNGELTSDEVAANYFKTMRIPLLKGRFFSDQDAPDSPRVAIINETMARRFFPGEDPVGKRFKFGSADSKSPYTSILGVVGDMRIRGLDKQTVSQIFLPLSYEPNESVTLVVRTTADDPLKLAGAVRREIQSVDKRATIFAVNTAKGQLENFNSQRSFQTSLLGLFSLVALVLAAVGVYGVVSYSVTQRTHEIGIRLALGARGVDVLRLIVSQGLTLVLFGVATGFAAAFALTHVIAGLLYEVSPTDPLTFGMSAVLLMLVALAACYIPARRATKVDPLVALRDE